jgi:hypothetical protein
MFTPSPRFQQFQAFILPLESLSAHIPDVDANARSDIPAPSILAALDGVLLPQRFG